MEPPVLSDTAYRRIRIFEQTEREVCRIEGSEGFRMSLHVQGEWEEKLRLWHLENDGGR